MDAATLRSVYRYGAILSVVATGLAVVGALVNGSNSVLALFFGVLGPLGVLFFGGAYLSGDASHYVLGEELLRGVAWYTLALLGWAVIVDAAAAIEATPLSVFGLPALTAVGLVALFVGVRSTTGLDLTIDTDGGQLLLLIIMAVVGAFVVGYLILAEGYSPALGLLYAAGSAVGLAYWWTSARPSRMSA